MLHVHDVDSAKSYERKLTKKQTYSWIGNRRGQIIHNMDISSLV